MSHVPAAATHPPDFVSVRYIREHYGVSRSTLRRWADAGHVRVVRFAGGTGRRLYHFADVEAQLGVDESGARQAPALRYTYARVSSAHQRADLERQQAYLLRTRPDSILVDDVASGLNWHRPGCTRILRDVLNRRVEEVAVAHRDRLCRFGFDLLDFIARECGARLVVLGDRAPHQADRDADADHTRELADDLLAIVGVFVARHNGQRAAQQRQQRRAASEREQQQCQTGDSEDRRTRVRAESPTERRAQDPTVPDE